MCHGTQVEFVNNLLEFSPSSMWVLGIELGSPGLSASTITQYTILLALLRVFCHSKETND